jgi:hypothetical protein
LPLHTTVSADGNFAFFTTPAALLPADVDGEVPIEPAVVAGVTGEFVTGEFSDNGSTTSPSSDVYEWRRAGVDGCVQVQGCLALITDGRGGYINLVLGSAHEGRDVFVYTRSKLVSQDRDTSGDIYDVRIGGGFAGPAPRAVECEGDACSTPPGPPSDATPSSLTFMGPGNLVSEIATPASSKAKPKPKAKRRCKAKAMKRCKAKHKGRKAAKHARHAPKTRRTGR